MSIEPEMYCSRHPKVATAVRCASCETPICTKCMVTTPVGMKCPSCAKGKNTVLTQVRPERAALAFVTAMAAGAIATIFADIGFIMIFLAMGFGYFAGTMILKASGMKRGLKMEIIAGAGMLIGGILFRLLPGLLFHQALAKSGYTAIMFGTGVLIDPWLWVSLGITTSCAISKIRYM